MTRVDVYLPGLRLDDGELLIVASDKADPDAIAIYAKRWEIETLFACLKENGFNLEKTRVTDRARIKRLLVVRNKSFTVMPIPDQNPSAIFRLYFRTR
jgi:hypothetical protein